MADGSDMYEDVLTGNVLSMGTLGSCSIDAGGELWCSQPCIFEEFTRFHLPKVDASWFAIMLPCQKFTVRADHEEHETAYAGWYKKCKNWGGWRDPTSETHTSFMCMHFLLSYGKVEYESCDSLLMRHLQTDGVVSEAVELDLWCSSFHLKGAACWKPCVLVKYIDFEIWVSQHKEKYCQVFVGWHRFEVFAVPLERHGELFVLVPAWWTRYNPRRELHVLISPVLPYCTRVYINCRDEKAYVEMISRMENAPMVISYISWRVVTVVCHTALVIYCFTMAVVVLSFC